MDLGLSLSQNRRLILLALPLVALVCIAGLALTTDAALRDPEPPAQYDTHDTAYVLSQAELGTRLTIRKEGGGDRDYIKIPFLNNNDIVTVTINQSQANNQVEYWVEDANKFPIYFYQYNGLPASPNFTFNFAAIVSGPYYIYHGQGFGTSYINMTIDRVPISPAPPEKDSNNIPLAKVLLTSDQKVTDQAGLPWDPHDFYYINIQPNANTNKYLSITIDTDEENVIQWEIYDNTGITRPSLLHTSDALLIGSSDLEHRRITVAGDYIFRIWMIEGYGYYNLTVSVLSYPNDLDNSVDEATTVMDDSEMSGDVNLTFDRSDYYEIFLHVDEPLWVEMTPMNGPADLYVFDEFENQKAASRMPDMAMDHIDGWGPDVEGYYYIVVEAVYEAPNWENPPTVSYDLKVWINFKPEINLPVRPELRNYHLDEDTVDTEFDVTELFKDQDGDPLTYDLDMSYNNTLIDIQLQGDDTLRIQPVANASDFKVSILINATDPHGLWVNYTVTVWVDPVNDAPFVDEADIPGEITMGEDLVKSGVNVTKMFRDVDDDYSTWTFTVTSADHVNVGIDDDTWLATFTPLVDDWWGNETFTVTCKDSGGLTAVVTMYINMREINDPPVIVRYIDAVEMEEEDSVTYDLLDYKGGPVFEDVEGAVLTYKYETEGNILVAISGSQITFTGAQDFVGSDRNVKIWAEDNLGARSANMTIFFTVTDKNDPPKLEIVLSTATVQEGTDVTFTEGTYYTFEDDSDPLTVAWNWYVDGVQVPPEQVSDKYEYTYTPPVTADKDRTVIVKLEVIDGEFTKEIEWTISVTNKNVKPDVPEFTFDTNKTKFKEGEKLTFSASGTDLDGDELTYKWFLDELEQVGTGQSVELTNVKKGTHKISVEVTDTSGATNRADYTFDVEKKSTGGDDSPGFGGPLVALALLGAVSIIVAYRRRR